MAIALTTYPQQQHVAPTLVADLPAVAVPGLYIHVPFCFHKCHYCDFYSITRQSESRMEKFVDLILREADFWTGHAGPSVCPRTVFFGGGTPSLLPLPMMRRLIAGLRDRFDLSAVAEWTIEVNPATARADYCAMLRGMGVDRLSFGAQSFDRAELKALERHHDPDDVPASLEAARAAGFSRLNLDLIYAIPGQSLDSWSANLEAALSLGTSHLSCYGLTYEPNTPMAVKKRLGQFQGVNESIELTMLHHARRCLKEAGMPPYEISNYAAPGQECRHNLLYWAGEDYIGLGPSAASHVQGRRWRNRPHLGEWESAVAGGAPAAADFEYLTPEQRWGELAMLNLRLTRGLELDDFTFRTGQNAGRLFAGQIERLSRHDLIAFDGYAVRLTEKGLDVADAVAAEFLAPEPL